MHCSKWRHQIRRSSIKRVAIAVTRVANLGVTVQIGVAALKLRSIMNQQQCSVSHVFRITVVYPGSGLARHVFKIYLTTLSVA
jgi:hypothetical protein